MKQELETKYKSFIEENGISPSTSKKRKETLFSSIESRIFEWESEAMIMLSDYSKNRSKFIGNKHLSE